MPLTENIGLNLFNEGWRPMPYTLSVAVSNGFTLTLPQPTGEVGPIYPASIQLTIEISQTVGVYSAELLIESLPETTNAPATVPIEIHVVPQVYKTMLPALLG
jgi:hypothetical protein